MRGLDRESVATGWEGYGGYWLTEWRHDADLKGAIRCLNEGRVWAISGGCGGRDPAQGERIAGSPADGKLALQRPGGGAVD
jgi:hypothetical protein